MQIFKMGNEITVGAYCPRCRANSKFAALGGDYRCTAPRCGQIAVEEYISSSAHQAMVRETDEAMARAEEGKLVGVAATD